MGKSTADGYFATEMDAVPGFWMNETSGVLAPVVMAHLRGDYLTPGMVAVMRAYLRQWVNAPGFRGPEVEALRREVDGLDNHSDLIHWLNRADDAGIDPF